MWIYHTLFFNFVKHKLKAKYYIRYVDDFVVLHKNKRVLEEWKMQINEFLKSIKLELHPEKSKIYPLNKGVNFLGHRVFYHFRLPAKRNLRKFDKNLNALLSSYSKGEISSESLWNITGGWLEYASWSDTYKMRRKINSVVRKAIKEKQKEAINFHATKYA